MTGGGIGLAGWLRDAAARLAAVSDTPRLDAELLAAHALGCEREAVLLGLPRLAVPANADALLARRMVHEPVAHITGWRDFWTLRLRVTADVLIPRPDSETLIEAAVEHFAGRAGPARILDLGTGSGALLLAALTEWPGAVGIGVDASPAALLVAEDNARQCGLSARAAFDVGDWGKGVAGRFDLILCNPPYIGDYEPLAEGVSRYEPHAALFAGADGLDAYRALVPDIARLLADDGIAVVEIGHTQADSTASLFAGAGLRAVQRRDLAGRARCQIVRR